MCIDNAMETEEWMLHNEGWLRYELPRMRLVDWTEEQSDLWRTYISPILIALFVRATWPSSNTRGIDEPHRSRNGHRWTTQEFFGRPILSEQHAKELAEELMQREGIVEDTVNHFLRNINYR